MLLGNPQCLFLVGPAIRWIKVGSVVAGIVIRELDVQASNPRVFAHDLDCGSCAPVGSEHVPTFEMNVR